MKKCSLKKTGPVTITRVNERSNTHVVEDSATGHRNTVHAKHLSPHGTFRPLPDKQNPDLIAYGEQSSEDEEDDIESSSSSSDPEDEEPEQNEADIDARNILSGKRSRKPVDRGFFVRS